MENYPKGNYMTNFSEKNAFPQALFDDFVREWSNFAITTCSVNFKTFIRKLSG